MTCSLGNRPECVNGPAAAFLIGTGELALLTTLTLTLPEICSVPWSVTGSGVFITVTGAEPVALAGLLGNSESASVTIPKLKAINISLLNCFMLVLLTDETYQP